MCIPILKLFAISLVAWVILGTTASGGFAALTLGILLLLFALLDAAQIVTPGTGRDAPINDADIGALVRRLFSLAVGPFYLVLIVLGCAGILGRAGREDLRLPAVATLPGAYPVAAQTDTTMCGGHGCGSAGGCGTGGCGASSGGACGCSSGAKKVSAPSRPLPTGPEMIERAKAVQKRTMGIPVANLPGIGPNAKPLPPGLVPNPNVPMPPKAQKLLDAAKAPAQNPTSNPNPAATPAVSPAATPPPTSPAPPAVAPATSTPLPAGPSTAAPSPQAASSTGAALPATPSLAPSPPPTVPPAAEGNPVPSSATNTPPAARP